MDERSAALGSLIVVAAFATSAATLALPAPARGQEPLEARVILPACPGGYGGLPLRRLLILELTDAGVASLEVLSRDDEDAPGEQVTVRLEAVCEDDGLVAIAVDGRVGEPSVRQQLDLREVDAQSRPRAVAVAVAEQVRLQRLLAADTELVSPPDDPSPPRPVRPPPPTVRSEVDVEVPPALTPTPEAAPAAPPPLRGSLTLAFEARGFPELATWPIGARLGAWLFVLDVLRVGFDLGPGFTSTEHPAGRVETWLVTVGFSLGARWAVTEEVGITPAVRVDLGYASFSGFSEPAVSSRGEGLALAVLGGLTFDVSLGSRVGFLVELDVGSTVVAHVAVAGDESVAGTRGVALGLRTGLAFHL